MNAADKIGMTCQRGRAISLLFHVVARTGHFTVKLRYLKRWRMPQHNSVEFCADPAVSSRFRKHISSRNKRTAAWKHDGHKAHSALTEAGIGFTQEDLR
jgi:hypothetical protein